MSLEMCKIVLLVALVSVQNVHSKGFTSDKNNYELIGIYDCDVAKDPIQKDFRMLTDYFASKLSFLVDLPFDVDDSITFQVGLSKYVNRDWTNDGSTVGGIFCQGLEIYLPEIWEQVANAINITNTCPIPKGTYKLNNFILDTSKIHDDLPKIEAGHYLIHTDLFKDEKPLACKQFEVKVE